MRSWLKITRLHLMLLFLFSVHAYTFAGIVIKGNTNVKVISGTNLTTQQVVQIQPGGILQNSGTIILKGGFQNDNSSPTDLGSGVYIFSGTLPQVISGENIFSQLTIENVSGVSLAGDCRVNTMLNMVSGKLILGNSHLAIGPSGIISGSFSPACMIVASDSGELRRELPVGFSGTILYPVGDQNNTAEYSPVTIQVNSGTFISGNYAGINLKNNPFPGIITDGNYLNRFWNFTGNAITGLDCNILFTYVTNDVTGDEGSISCTRVSPLPRYTFGPANTTDHTLLATGINDFGTFTGLKTNTPASVNELKNITLTAGMVNCYDAILHLVVAGGNSTFAVQNNGSATLIAGERITMLPGTSVAEGGFLHAYITADSTFCGSMPLSPLLSAGTGSNNTPYLFQEVLATGIRVYPNPAKEYFLVEFCNNSWSSEKEITLYTLQGTVILHKTTTESRKVKVDVTGLPPGMLILSVLDNGQISSVKIIKQ